MANGDEISRAAAASTRAENKAARANPFASLGIVAGNIAKLRAVGKYMTPSQRLNAQDLTRKLQSRGTSAVGGKRIQGTNIDRAVAGRRLAMSASQRMTQSALSSARATMTKGQISRARASLRAAKAQPRGRVTAAAGSRGAMAKFRGLFPNAGAR